MTLAAPARHRVPARSRPRPLPFPHPDSSPRGSASPTGHWIGLVVLLAAAVRWLPSIHWVNPLIGLVFTIGVPAVQLVAKLRLYGSPRSHRVVIAIAASVLLLMATMLALNTVLPLLGDREPLRPAPIVVTVALLDAALVLWRREETPSFASPRWTVRRPVVIAWGLLGIALLTCVAGANRLNNGASGSVTLFSFGVLLVGVVVIWRQRASLGDGQIAAMLYLIGLVLLLATSLRGWYITGHDIQREYRVFQISYGAHRWDISAFKNSYNACMSLTVLPSAFAATWRMDPVYVFKIIAQMFFALAPAVLYLLCRTQFTRAVSFLAVIFFVGFPTFFTDLPFITRQEYGFTFLSVALLVLTSGTWSLAARRAWFVFFGVGIILSHYSTTYVLLIALAAAMIMRSWPRLWRRIRRRGSGLAVDRLRPVAGASVTIALAILAALWTGPLTHTSSQLEQTVRDTADTLLGRGNGSQSTDVGYGLFHGSVATPAQELGQYKQTTLAQNVASRIPAAVVDGYPTPVVPEPDQRLTGLGQAINDVAVSPSLINSMMRSVLADYYQAAAVIGLILVAWRYRRSRTATAAQREYVLLGAASFIGLLAVLVLPDLSVEYGLLRAFQQALLLLAPLVAETTMALAGLVFRRWRAPLALTFGITSLASLIGFIPQALGGYPAQLSLNNSGTYYNDYYLHPQEEDTVAWLVGHVGTASVQSEIQTDRYTFFLINSPNARTSGDIFPTLIQRDAYVFVGYSTVTQRIASVSVNGNTVSYRYPTGLLDDHKNLVFATNGARIYR